MALAVVANVALIVGLAVALTRSNENSNSSSSGGPGGASSSQALPSSPEVPAEPSSSMPSPPRTYKIGGGPESVSSEAGGSMDIYVTQVRTATVEPGDYGSTPERGLFVVFDVKAVGTGGVIDIGLYDFYLVTSSGEHIEDAAVTVGWGPELDVVTLHKGEHATGVLVYDSGPAGAHGKLVYSPNYDGYPLGQWPY